MENVVLIIHLLLALGLIAVVLLQRSEGGGLGMGGGGGGAMTGRGVATALSKITWALAAAFIATSITLTILAAEKSAGGSVTDSLTQPALRVSKHSSKNGIITTSSSSMPRRQAHLIRAFSSGAA